MINLRVLLECKTLLIHLHFKHPIRANQDLSMQKSYILINDASIIILDLLPFKPFSTSNFFINVMPFAYIGEIH